jgi:hypothetical protein
VSELEKWILSIGGAVFAALVAAFWKHVVEDGKTRERVAHLETDNETTKAEVKSLRDRWHHFRDETMKDAWQMFQEWKDEMVERFSRRRGDKDE